MNAIALCKNLITYQVCSMRHVSHMFLGSTWKSCRWNHFWMHAIEMLWFAILFQGFKCVISWFEFSSTQTFILEWHSICKHYLKHGSPYQLFLWFLCWCNGWFSVQKSQIVLLKTLTIKTCKHQLYHVVMFSFYLRPNEAISLDSRSNLIVSFLTGFLVPTIANMSYSYFHDCHMNTMLCSLGKCFPPLRQFVQ